MSLEEQPNQHCSLLYLLSEKQFHALQFTYGSSDFSKCLQVSFFNLICRASASYSRQKSLLFLKLQLFYCVVPLSQSGFWWLFFYYYLEEKNCIKTNSTPVSLADYPYQWKGYLVLTLVLGQWNKIPETSHAVEGRRTSSKSFLLLFCVQDKLSKSALCFRGPWTCLT